MNALPAFDGEWVVDDGTNCADAIREIIAYYLPDTRVCVDSTRFTTDRRIFRPGESVWGAIEELAAIGGMELDEDGKRVWVRHRG